MRQVTLTDDQWELLVAMAWSRAAETGQDRYQILAEVVEDAEGL